ncbi:MAG: penicillin-binding transpeptidase domain-containing protein [Defluviitaleaceae bacterium]|nr:penicillin-binding transpeptidase domain-containing protein [Defluviitaleaceae bacterium]
MAKKIFGNIIAFFTNRLLIIFVGICIMFYILTVELFSLQIIEGERHLELLSTNIAREISLSAQRGNIYDRLGRPLAVNQFAYSVTINPSILMPIEELNEVILELMRLLERNGETFIDDLPISMEEPFEFTFLNLTRQIHWVGHRGMDLVPRRNINLSTPEGIAQIDELAAAMTAEEAINELRRRWRIPEELSNREARNIISIRSKMFLVRFQGFQPIELAQNVSLETVTQIMEDPERFRSLDVQKNAMRYYPEGRYLAHIVGYVGRINAEELEMMAHLGYAPHDIIGKTGIELAFESNLRGADGSLTVTIDPWGRRVSDVLDSRVEPRQGDNIFLSVDAALQRQSYYLAKEILTEIIIGRLTNPAQDVHSITARDVLASLVAANNISPREIFESEPGSASFSVYAYVMRTNPEATIAQNADRREVNQIIAQGIEDGDIALSTILLVLWEQGIITGSTYYAERIRNGWITPTQVIVEKMQEGEITPAMTNIDPATASLVVVDVRTGGILAAVSYPSFDTNEFMNNTNELFPRLNNDPTSPMINRPFSEEQPPGSSFKMASAIAGLESGIINANSTVYDGVVFTRAGRPYARCHNRFGCGHVGVVEAIGVSCNYFFFDTFYRLGNARDNNTLHSIGTLNRFMSLLTFDEPTGVEIGEANRARGKSPLNMATPELKYLRFSGDLRENPNWLDGNTTHAVIGQGFNSYTPAVMARYTAILATRGERTNFSLLNRIVTENEVLERVPVRSSIGSEISDRTWDLIHDGMRNTIIGPRGTARNIFAGFPIPIGGKTGTAEHGLGGRPDHTTFSAFAPFDNPEIAIYVMIPFSDARTMPSPATVLARRVLEAYFKFDSGIEEPIPVNTFSVQ